MEISHRPPDGRRIRTHLLLVATLLVLVAAAFTSAAGRAITVAPPTLRTTVVPATASPATAYRSPTSAPSSIAAASITVPASIDATCGTSVSAELNAWIASQPDGSTLVFPAGSCYRLGGDAGLNLAKRNGLTLIGTGSRLQLRTTGASNFSSAFFLEQSDHITIRGFAVDGGNEATGTTAAASAIDESISGAAIRAGSDFVEFDDVSWDRLRGFGVFISDDGGAGDWPEDVSIHDSVIRGGEMGVAITAGRRVQILRNAINDSVYIAIDLEPDQPQHGFEDVLISDNTVSRYAWGQTLTSWFVAANPADAVVGSAVMDGLTITGNRVEVGAATANNGNADGLGGLGIRASKSNRKTDFVIKDNWTSDDDTQSASSGVIHLANVENLTVTGNRQPIKNGSAFVQDTGTTGSRLVSDNDVSAAASPAPAPAPPATAPPARTTRRIPETNASIVRTGRWGIARHKSYAGKRVIYSERSGSTATFRFDGRGIAWIGPAGPTRGKARVSVDGVAIRTVSLWRSRFKARAMLFSKRWTEVGTHTIRITVIGNGRPVAIDEFVLLR